MNRLASPNALLPRVIADPIDRLRSDFEQMISSGTPRGIFNWSQPAFPAVDLRDHQDAYLLTAETPGYARDDLEVTCSGDCLTIRGQRAESSDRQEAGLIVSERNEGAFERQISLPGRVDPARIEAKLNDGVLEVKMPKIEDPSRKTIPIKIGKEK